MTPPVEKLSDFFFFAISASGSAWEGCIFSCWPLRLCWHDSQRVNTKCCCYKANLHRTICPPKPTSGLLYPLLPSLASPVHCNTKTSGVSAPPGRNIYRSLVLLFVNASQSSCLAVLRKPQRETWTGPEPVTQGGDADGPRGCTPASQMK